MRKRLLIIGAIITSLWAAYTIFVAVTAVEMEILLAVAILIIGGYILGNYFLFSLAITATTKKGKKVGFLFFTLWLLIPVFYYAKEQIQHLL